MSSPGREGNGLDLNCSLVLILATTELDFPEVSDCPALPPAACPGLTPDMWKRFRSQESQVTPTAHPASLSQKVGTGSQPGELSHRLVSALG